MKKKFVIPRDKWVRGRDAALDGLSQLLNERGSQCCVGHYLSSCGVEPVALQGLGAADDVVMERIPEEARWLIISPDECDPPRFDYPGRPKIAQELYDVNDSVAYSEVEREMVIKQMFADQGIEVEFIDTLEGQ